MLIKNIFSNSIFTFTRLALSLLVNIIISRLLLDPSAYGIFNLAISYIGILIIILGLGVNGALVRFSKEELTNNNLKRFISECYSNVFAIQFLFITVIVIFSDFFSNLIFNDSNFQYLIYFICFCLIAETIQLWISSIFWGLNDFKLRGISISIIPLFKFIFLGVAFFSLKTITLNLIVYLVVLSEVISLGLLLLFYKKKIGNLPFKFFKYPALGSKNVKKAFSFGLWSMLSAIGMLLMNLIDKIFITKFVSLEILGKYTILISLLSYFTLSITMVSNVLLSNYLKIWEENKSFVVKRINTIYFYLLILLMIGSIVFRFFSDFIIQNLYGQVYLGLGYLIPIMLIAVFYNTNYMIMGNLAAISKNPKYTTYSFLIGLLINIIGNSLFTPKYGVEAIVITTSVSYFFIATSMSLFLKNSIKEFSLKPLMFAFISSIFIFYVS